ncbi:2-oxo acid dehydrogenase subunit E2 [Bordetella pertussis]
MSQLNDLLMPKLGLTMTEGMLIEWSVTSGAEVKAGDSLFVVETDKVANEIVAQADGTLAEILVAAGETVPVGTVVARWTGPGQGADDMADAPRLTLNHFVIAAVARALAAMPHQNRIWNDDHIVQFQGIDVGVAVSTERGLMAPVLHGLDHASLDDIAAQSDALLGRVRAGKATREDMSGGAISISNTGMFNVTYMAPIINPPQSAILGVGSIRELFRPDEQGAPALRREMGLVLAADHRLHDGASALAFLNHVIDLLQDPYRLLRNRPHTKG